MEEAKQRIEIINVVDFLYGYKNVCSYLTNVFDNVFFSCKCLSVSFTYFFLNSTIITLFRSEKSERDILLLLWKQYNCRY